jgi:spoIIIJ-associated protein
MSSSDTIEATAATIDQAVGQALTQLGAEQDDVTIEVLSTPRSGVLGLGARPARVRVTRRAPAGARSGVMSPPPAPPLRPTPPEIRRPETGPTAGHEPQVAVTRPKLDAPPVNQRREPQRAERDFARDQREFAREQRDAELEHPERSGSSAQGPSEQPRTGRSDLPQPERGGQRNQQRRSVQDRARNELPGRDRSEGSHHERPAPARTPPRIPPTEGRDATARDDTDDRDLRKEPEEHAEQRRNGRADGAPRRGRGRGRGGRGHSDGSSVGSAVTSSGGPSGVPGTDYATGRERGGQRSVEAAPHHQNLERDDDRDPFAAVDEAGNDPRQIVDLREQAREATIFLERILGLMGEQAVIEAAESDDPETLELNIKGDGSGILIGRHGQTLDAIEYMVNRLLARKIKDAAPISIDTESYRARRRRLLQRLALSKGEQAKREHVTVTLDPMPPRDRRIVHLTLKDDPMIATRSTGVGFMRAIEIVPVDERRDPNERGNENRGRGRDRTRERDQDKVPIGEQGGFKHGQKRIV